MKFILQNFYIGSTCFSKNWSISPSAQTFQTVNIGNCQGTYSDYGGYNWYGGGYMHEESWNWVQPMQTKALQQLIHRESVEDLSSCFYYTGIFPLLKNVKISLFHIEISWIVNIQHVFLIDKCYVFLHYFTFANNFIFLFIDNNRCRTKKTYVTWISGC